jgi:hypothetical protein
VGRVISRKTEKWRNRQRDVENVDFEREKTVDPGASRVEFQLDRVRLPCTVETDREVVGWCGEDLRHFRRDHQDESESAS